MRLREATEEQPQTHCRGDQIRGLDGWPKVAFREATGALASFVTRVPSPTLEAHLAKRCQGHPAAHLGGGFLSLREPRHCIECRAEDAHLASSIASGAWFRSMNLWVMSPTR